MRDYGAVFLLFSWPGTGERNPHRLAGIFGVPTAKAVWRKLRHRVGSDRYRWSYYANIDYEVGYTNGGLVTLG